MAFVKHITAYASINFCLFIFQKAFSEFAPLKPCAILPSIAVKKIKINYLGHNKCQLKIKNAAVVTLIITLRNNYRNGSSQDGDVASNSCTSPNVHKPSHPDFQSSTSPVTQSSLRKTTQLSTCQRENAVFQSSDLPSHRYIVLPSACAVFRPLAVHALPAIKVSRYVISFAYFFSKLILLTLLHPF